MAPPLNFLFARITKGQLTIREPDGTEHRYGTKGTGPEATIIVHDNTFYRRIITGGSLGLGETYMEGIWEAKDGDFMNVAAVLLLNRVQDAVPKAVKRFAQWMRGDFGNAFNPRKSKDNVQYHYDLGNDFYELFLDENMGYTCGYQITEQDTSEQMQDQKHELVCRKLGLKPGERIVDLGCGWGGMLRYGAKHFGISGVGYTLSEGQVAWGNAKIKEEGLQDKIHIELKDYREAKGQYDKVVSIGMAEHAWEGSYETLMRTASSLLPMGGIGLIHTIGSIDPSHNSNEPWISKYIFPGARIPRLHELVLAANNNLLTIGHVENLKLHYAKTLRHWKNKFDSNKEKIKTLSPRYDEKFLRMWDCYLQGCEAGFRYSTLQLYQLLFCKGIQWTLPMNLEFGLPTSSR